MGSKNRIMIFAAIVLHLFLHFPSQTEAGAELVSKVCKQSQDYQSCVQILTSHPQTLSASEKKAIAEKALALARKESVDTSDFFTGLAHTHPASKTVLEQCASYFKEAVTFLNLKGLKGGTASLDVHYALDDAESCESALSSGHVHIDSATARIQKWKTVYRAAEAAVIALEN
jgi:pectinesterase inhibitor-like protein